MPLYEYKCSDCGQVFEVIQRFSDAPLTTHDGCGGNVERLLSAPALQFKGSGWYITDYGKSGGPTKSSSSSKSDSSASDSKPSADKPAAASKSSDSK